MIDLHEIIIERSARDKAALLNRRRDELKPLGYSIVDSKYLTTLMVLAKRLAPKEMRRLTRSQA